MRRRRKSESAFAVAAPARDMAARRIDTSRRLTQNPCYAAPTGVPRAASKRFAIRVPLRAASSQIRALKIVGPIAALRFKSCIQRAFSLVGETRLKNRANNNRGIDEKITDCRGAFFHVQHRLRLCAGHDDAGEPGCGTCNPGCSGSRTYVC